MFWTYLRSSSGGTTVCIQKLVFINLFRLLLSWLDWNPTSTTDIHIKRLISTNCCVHTVVSPGDEPRYARNKLRLTKCTYLLHGAESFLRSFAASQEIPRIYGTRKSLTVPTNASHLSLS